MAKPKFVVTGAAGLVGQNLLKVLDRPDRDIVAIDKSAENMEVLRRFHPKVRTVVADLAEPGAWEQQLTGCDALVVGHAQIGGLAWDDFERNNIRASENLVRAALTAKVPYLVNISSSVVNSQAVDFYTESKKAQERLVRDCGIAQVILRPTLMFGWFDRKHLGWLARFMSRVPVFPVPGNGRFLRQPLYVGDFCEIIAAAIDRRITGPYDISGQERIDYIDLIRAVRSAVGARTPIVRVPYRLFWSLLKVYGWFSANPPFTTKQLEALVTPDVFDVIDWPGIFGVKSTPLDVALRQTFGDPRYASIALRF